MPTHFPARDLPGWNKNWLDGTDDWRYALADTRVVNKFIDALNERLTAVNWPYDGGSPPYTPLAHAATDDSIFTAWKNVISRLNDLLQNIGGTAASFVRAYQESGDPDTYYTGYFDSGYEQLPDWVKATVKRRYPRWIDAPDSSASTQGDAAADGQIARLVGSSGSYGSNTGQLYLRSSGTWALDPSAELPDKVVHDTWTEAGTPLLVAQGCYFDANFLQEVRDMINQLVMVLVGPQDHDPGGPLAWASGGINSSNGAPFGGGISYFSTYADAVASFNSETYLSTDTGDAPFAWNVGRFDSDGSHYRLARAWATPRVTSLPAGVLSYQVFFALMLPAAAFADDATTTTFNDWGDGASDTQCQGFSSSGVITDTEFIGDQYGTSTAPATAPTGSDPAVIGSGYILYPGFSTETNKNSRLGAFIRYDVEGGFAYTKAT